MVDVGVGVDGAVVFSVVVLLAESLVFSVSRCCYRAVVFRRPDSWFRVVWLLPSSRLLPERLALFSVSRFPVVT